MDLYDSFLERFARSRFGGWMFVNVFTHVDRRLMAWSKGALNTGVGSRLQGNVVLLTTTGAKSGKRRQTPLLFIESGDDIVLIASRAGHARNPAWYHNLKGTPRCHGQIAGRSCDFIAREATGAERQRLWQDAVGIYAGFDDYAERTGRTIPVMVLTPADQVN